MTTEIESLYYLLIALAIGLMIGIERGWQERASLDGQRIAGVRTYGLIGLLGGVFGVLTQKFGPLLLGLGFIALSTVIGIIFLAKQRQEGDWGITSLVAALLVFILGALATTGAVLQASSIAVVTVVLLSYKPQLHNLIGRLQIEELRAGMKLLLISVVMLPVLPDQGYGPWQSLNPYRIWLMVVLIATISFAGYFAIKIGGARRGILFTGLFGGLASSTAVTLHLSRLGKQNADLVSIVASAILIACGTMYLRIIIVIALLAPSLLSSIWWLMLLMATLTFFPLVFYQKGSVGHQLLNTSSTLKNPLDLKMAFGFGAILTIVMLLSVVLRQVYGDAGLMTLAAMSGIADVDAILLSLIGIAGNDLGIRLFVMGCVIAASMNSFLKAIMSSVIGGPALFVKVSIPLSFAAIVGLVSALIVYW
ncbi:MgtC/SapB family protein [Methylophaga sp.]|uniref:MgtC/SapB family protein n=1 Tax=Methylophaga sp. TaxID=2024840 RepID=UPI003F6A1ABA